MSKQGDSILMSGQTPEVASAFRALLAERNSLAFLLKRFVDGEHDQGENQGERHMYHDEAEALLAYLGGEVQGHTLVPDDLLRAEHERKKALVADSDRYQFIADSACDVSFYVDNTDLGDGDTAPGPRVGLTPDQYPVEMFGSSKAKLDFAVDVLMASKNFATPSTDNENVSRHEGR
ncbi:hypothetical protein P3C29_02695 [Pseudomonas sp. 1912-s]|uniref:hypothetical protein n=1 Tax=Pseudomonas sp. 1912-s TaxID=3033802 RepID=UPI0023DEF39D|nr:hypothetical protein [Pseudomonas sp. 1912-s]MDF3197570.1 hypothetical protein [Pseudomonas sp. 1912-s]